MLSQRERVTVVSVVGIEEEKAIGIVGRSGGESDPRLVVPLIVQLLKDGAQGNDSVAGNA